MRPAATKPDRPSSQDKRRPAQGREPTRCNALYRALLEVTPECRWPSPSVEDGSSKLPTGSTIVVSRQLSRVTFRGELVRGTRVRHASPLHGSCEVRISPTRDTSGSLSPLACTFKVCLCMEHTNSEFRQHNAAVHAMISLCGTGSQSGVGCAHWRRCSNARGGYRRP